MSSAASTKFQVLPAPTGASISQAGRPPGYVRPYFCVKIVVSSFVSIKMDRVRGAGQIVQLFTVPRRWTLERAPVRLSNVSLFDPLKLLNLKREKFSIFES